MDYCSGALKSLGKALDTIHTCLFRERWHVFVKVKRLNAVWTLNVFMNITTWYGASGLYKHTHIDSHFCHYIAWPMEFFAEWTLAPALSPLLGTAMPNVLVIILHVFHPHLNWIRLRNYCIMLLQSSFRILFDAPWHSAKSKMKIVFRTQMYFNCLKMREIGKMSTSSITHTAAFYTEILCVSYELLVRNSSISAEWFFVFWYACSCAFFGIFSIETAHFKYHIKKNRSTAHLAQQMRLLSNAVRREFRMKYLFTWNCLFIF